MHGDQREVLSLEKYTLTETARLRRSAVMTAVLLIPMCIMLLLVFALLAAAADTLYHFATVTVLAAAVILLFGFSVGGTLLLIRDIRRGGFYMAEDILEYVNKETDESLTKRLFSERYNRSVVVLGFAAMGEMKLDSNFPDFPERWHGERFYVIIRKRNGKVLALYKTDAYKWTGETGTARDLIGKDE